MTSWSYPDVSQYTPVDLAGAPVVFARATIGLARDTHYATFVANAGARGVPLGAYHFLNSGQLGASPEAQADLAFSVIGTRATMLDHEPNRGYCATFAEGMRFINRYRANGGVLHLDYLPHWSWQGWMGSPLLTPLRDAGVKLVTSSYTAYSDGGPGWTPYGGLAADDIAAWQYADNHSFNGGAVDWNAVKRPFADFIAMINGTDGGTDMSINDIVPQTGGKTVGMCLSDIFHTVSDGYSGYVPTARMPIPAVMDATYAALGKLAQALAALANQDQAEAQAILNALKSAATVDVPALATAIAADLIAAGDINVSDADLVRVGQVVQDKLTTTLGQVRLITGGAA